jgi:TolA-binding protein
MKAPLALLLVCNALFFTSCSSLLSHRGQTVDSVQQGQSTAPMAMVPKEQYDELARKYQELINLSKNQLAKTEAPAVVAPESAPVVAPHNIDSNVQTKPEVGASTAIDPSELVNRIDKAIPDTAALDSVDALKSETRQGAEKGPPVPTSMGVQHVNNTDDIDEQITRLREVQELVKVNKFDNALTLLKELENSKEKQIVVRAKMMLGDLLFNQGEFDLASQVYEEVIKKYAFSGHVLKALGKLVACSEKLKQPEKQAKYYSLLHDFFEAS